VTLGDVSKYSRPHGLPGCFRCHDGSHTTADGNTITQACTACHERLAVEEASPEILKTLGLAGRMAKVQKKITMLIC
jgi:hypothetical protein